MFDKDLIMGVLMALMYAPILYLCSGYWMCSNRQLISNDYLTPREQATDKIYDSHTIWEAVSF